jgi:hemoglobin
MRKLLKVSLLAALALSVACGDDDDKKQDPKPDMAVPDQGMMQPDQAPPPDQGMMEPDLPPTPDMGPDMAEMTLYQRLGERANIQVVITSFVGRVLADDKINGYFLDDGFDGAKLIGCLVDQVGNLTGGPEQYPNANCRDMKSSHEGLGISTQDYNDLAGHLVAELQARGVAQADIDTIAGALTAPAFVADIVEDPDNNRTIYQRVGRKPAVTTVINGFVGRVLADDKINGYFLNNDLDAANLVNCLVRQVNNLTGGPDAYPNGPCRDMKSSHEGLGISTQDYNDLAGHLVAELQARNVPQADIDAIAGALTAPAFVADIVEDATNDGTIYQRLGRKPAITAVVNNFVGRLVGDATLAPFFAPSKLTDGSADRVVLCLVSQVCNATGGPCVYGKEAPLGAGNECKDMQSSHAGMTDTNGNPVTIAEFNALVGHLVAELQANNVAEADINAIGAALAPTCPDIVANGTGCPQ